MFFINMSSMFWKVLVFLFISIHSSDTQLEGKTIFVSVLFRHGDRTPYSFYPNDPYKDMSYWPEGVGQLTNIGKQQEYELGQWLRKRYDALLTEKYHPSLFYIQSTDVDRTLMSAECALAGMFPPNGTQVWNPHLEWQPIPIHTPGKKDDAFTGYAPCPAFNAELKKILESKELQEIDEKYAQVYEVLKKNTGEDKHGLAYLADIYSTLYVENLKNHTLPEWTKSIFPKPLDEASIHHFTLDTRTKKLARFKAGLMIKTMINDMVGKTEGKPRNVHVYSAHDNTVTSLLNSLNVFDCQNPPYAACVMLELWETEKKDHVVAVFYHNYTVQSPYLMTIPGCATACPLDQFIAITKPLAITTDEWDRECISSSGLNELSTGIFLFTLIANVI